MSQIRLQKRSEQEDKFIFDVKVKDRDTSDHTVTVDKDYYQRLTKGEDSVENLIRRSFEFLLEREPQSAILSEFNLRIIKKYFPEYENKI